MCVSLDSELVLVCTVVREWGDIGPVEFEVVERPRDTVDSVVAAAVGFLLGTLLAPAAAPAPTGPL